MVILYTIKYDTKYDSKMLSQCICYTSETYQINFVSCAFLTIPSYISPFYFTQFFIYLSKRTKHLCRIHKPVLGTRYSGTVPCRKTCTNHDITVYNYVQLHIDDAILCIIDDVMIVLYGMEIVT